MALNEMTYKPVRLGPKIEINIAAMNAINDGKEAVMIEFLISSNFSPVNRSEWLVPCKVLESDSDGSGSIC